MTASTMSTSELIALIETSRDLRIEGFRGLRGEINGLGFVELRSSMFRMNIGPWSVAGLIGVIAAILARGA